MLRKLALKTSHHTKRLVPPKLSLLKQQHRTSFDSHFLADGSCGYMQRVREDSWSGWGQRNELLEDLYARARVQNLQAFLRDRIKTQEMSLERDKRLLKMLEVRGQKI